MKQFTENAKSFALDGGIANVYEYKDEEEEQVRGTWWKGERNVVAM